MALFDNQVPPSAYFRPPSFATRGNLLVNRFGKSTLMGDVVATGLPIVGAVGGALLGGPTGAAIGKEVGKLGAQGLTALATDGMRGTDSADQAELTAGKQMGLTQIGSMVGGLASNLAGSLKSPSSTPAVAPTPGFTPTVNKAALAPSILPPPPGEPSQSLPNPNVPIWQQEERLFGTKRPKNTQLFTFKEGGPVLAPLAHSVVGLQRLNDRAKRLAERAPAAATDRVDWDVADRLADQEIAFNRAHPDRAPGANVPYVRQAEKGTQFVRNWATAKGYPEAAKLLNPVSIETPEGMKSVMGGANALGIYVGMGGVGQAYVSTGAGSARNMPSLATHESTHQLQGVLDANPAMQQTMKLLNERTNPELRVQGRPYDTLSYLSSPTEQHARLMQMRQAVGQTPDKPFKRLAWMGANLLGGLGIGATNRRAHEAFQDLKRVTTKQNVFDSLNNTFKEGGPVLPYRYGRVAGVAPKPTSYTLYADNDHSEDLPILTPDGKRVYGHMRVGEYVLNQKRSLIAGDIMQKDIPTTSKVNALGHLLHEQLSAQPIPAEAAADTVAFKNGGAASVTDQLRRYRASEYFKKRSGLLTPSVMTATKGTDGVYTFTPDDREGVNTVTRHSELPPLVSQRRAERNDRLNLSAMYARWDDRNAALRDAREARDVAGSVGPGGNIAADQTAQRRAERRARLLDVPQPAETIGKPLTGGAIPTPARPASSQKPAPRFDPAVADLQRRLNAAGYVGANGKPLAVDGIRGVNTEYAQTAQARAATLPASTPLAYTPTLETVEPIRTITPPANRPALTIPAEAATNYTVADEPRKKTIPRYFATGGFAGPDPVNSELAKRKAAALAKLDRYEADIRLAKPGEKAPLDFDQKATLAKINGLRNQLNEGYTTFYSTPAAANSNALLDAEKAVNSFVGDAQYATSPGSNKARQNAIALGMDQYGRKKDHPDYGKVVSLRSWGPQTVTPTDPKTLTPVTAPAAATRPPLLSAPTSSAGSNTAGPRGGSGTGRPAARSTAPAAPPVTKPAATTPAVGGAIGEFGAQLWKSIEDKYAPKPRPQASLLGPIGGGKPTTMPAPAVQAAATAPPAAATGDAASTTAASNSAGLVNTLKDVGRLGAGILLATRPIEKPSGDSAWKTYTEEVTAQKDQGLTPTERSVANNALASNYRQGVTTLTNAVGGGASSGTVLAGLANLGAQRNNATQNLLGLDAARRAQNFSRFGSVAAQTAAMEANQQPDGIAEQAAGQQLIARTLQNAENRSVLAQNQPLYDQIAQNQLTQQQQAADSMAAMRDYYRKRAGLLTSGTAVS
ncbi:hypothetical protein [Fibrella aestuarina]|nr:hypothetical protein [Fibrella aestuarina]